MAITSELGLLSWSLTCSVATAVLEATCPRVGGTKGTLAANLSRLEIESPDPQPKRRFFRRVHEIGLAEFQELKPDASLLLDLQARASITGRKKMRSGDLQETPDHNAPAHTTPTAAQHESIVERSRDSAYIPAPKRLRGCIGDQARPDALQSVFYVYDYERRSASTDEQGGDAGGITCNSRTYVYDLYCMDDEAEAENGVEGVPVIQVDDFMDDLLVGDDGCRSSFDSQDSNDEDYYANDYPDEEDESTSCKEGYYGAEPDDYGYAAYDRDAGDDDWGLGGRLCSGSYGPSSNSGSEDGPSFRFS